MNSGPEWGTLNLEPYFLGGYTGLDKQLSYQYSTALLMQAD